MIAEGFRREKGGRPIVAAPKPALTLGERVANPDFWDLAPDSLESRPPMNPFVGEEDAWWWSLYTPGCMSKEAAQVRGCLPSASVARSALVKWE